MDKKKVTVYMMIGLPGAGKDTWIKNHLPDTPCVSTDDIREELGIIKHGEKGFGSIEQEKKVTNIANQRILEYVRNGQDVVINELNIKLFHRNIIKKVLSGFNVKWVYVMVEAPDLETNLIRRNGQVNPNVMRFLQLTQQKPTADEYDEIIYDKQEKI